jgi:hypothetical protein
MVARRIARFVVSASAVFVLLAAPATAVSDVPSPMLGTWTSATLDGMGNNGRPQCSVITVTDRKLTLKSEPGSTRVEGEWVRWTRNVWMTSDNLACRWYPEETTFEPVFGSIWTYSLRGSYDAQRQVLKVHGDYSNCLGNGCEKMRLGATSFDTEFTLQGDTLTDTNATPDPSDDLEFMRLAADSETVEDAREATEGWLKKLDGGDIDGFYDQATSTGFRQGVQRSQFHTVTAALIDRVGLVSSREFLLSTHVLYAPGLAKGRGNYVLFSNKVLSSKKMGGVEFLLVVKDGGDWKVQWLNYGS